VDAPGSSARGTLLSAASRHVFQRWMSDRPDLVRCL